MLVGGTNSARPPVNAYQCSNMILRRGLSIQVFPFHALVSSRLTLSLNGFRFHRIDISYEWDLTAWPATSFQPSNPPQFNFSGYILKSKRPGRAITLLDKLFQTRSK
ncbi:hypothetical protein Bpfe_000045 [Biomphalaria pfeifferi]|uniref:Uncharacterized protein n=1 Tax=Biomphalaria pfeifferi TaxID=112525 RepID=A0AAD8CC07_BIOPF|nr:hypothetical protein Bpfe_000045 [Biomphalaria pfeifferi]